MVQPPHHAFPSVRPAALLMAVVIAAVFSVSGCGQKPTAAAVVQNSQPEPDQSASASTPVAGNAPRVVPVAIAESADASVQLAQLTQVLRRYGMERRRVPQSLNELITAGYLTMLPPAPAGKQFAIDGKRMQVVIANR